MSCNCDKNIEPGEKFVCVCDQFTHPQPLNIGAGLQDLPRQVAGFSEFRRAMLRDIGRMEPLGSWRARYKDDLGIMLLEMWAYICDSISFYDKVIAEEAYLQTALLRPSLRKLVALLGYIPRPAVSSIVNIAANLDGRSPVVLPTGTAFRSSGFNGNPPQVFELTRDYSIHPFNNKWNIAPVRQGKIVEANPTSLLVELKADIKPFMLLLLLDYTNPTQAQALRVTNLEPYTGSDGRKYTRIIFESAAKLSAGTPLSQLWLLLPAPDSIMWHVANVFDSPTDGSKVALKESTKQYRIDTSFNWHFQALHGAVIRNGERTNEKPKPNLVELALRYAVPTAASIVEEPKPFLSPSDPLNFDKRAEAPPDDFRSMRFALIDKNLDAVAINGQVDFQNGALRLDQAQTWSPYLVMPVEVFANIIEASRGETVKNEILGSGDASVASQVFKLKKKPLAYLFAPSAASDQGVQSTLRIYVDGIRWKEVQSFYGIREYDEVYILRQNDEEETQVIFGDGVRGRRVPTGAGNIVAYYRFGAGQAAPPGGSITQIQTPVPRLGSINNPLAAAGGADRANGESLRKNAPGSSLIMGRAVSIPDMEAVSLSVPGVRAVKTEWRWSGIMQTACVHIWYIGDAGIEGLLSQRLRSLTDPTTPIAVLQAMAVNAAITLDIEIDPRYNETAVIDQVRAVLINPDTGFLLPELLGIGSPLFRSRIFSVVVAVEGVLSVRNILLNDELFDTYAKTPGAGRYFDFNNHISLNGKV